jgi:hypothetical protein
MQRLAASTAFIFYGSFALLAVHCSDSTSAGDSPTAMQDAATSAPDTGTGTTDSSVPPTPDAGCPAGLEDLDGDAANGCETKTPSGVDAASLALWLRADRGLTCANDRVTAWADQSGKGRNASPVAGHAGPACGALSGDVRGIDVPFFAAAPSPDAAVLDDDVLQVDLAFLAGAAYTVFEVDRRQAPNKGFSFVVGSGVPAFDNYDCSASGPNVNRGIHIGYREDALFWFDQFCNAGATNVAQLDAGGVDGGYGALTWSVSVNGATDGGAFSVRHSESIDGGVSGVPTPLVTSDNGRIGRGFGNTGIDTRFRGDIPEVIVFSKALSEGEITDVATYLKRHWGL